MIENFLEIILFLISILFSAVILYILGHLWFGDSRNRQSKSFFIMGIIVTLWTLLNGIAIISSEKFFPIIYSIRISLVAIVPFSVFWFILNFANVRFIKSRLALFITCLFPFLDVLAMLTNPLHHYMFLDYQYPAPARSWGFYIHTGIDLFVVLLAFGVLIKQIIKYAKKEPMLIITGVGMLIPYTLNFLYTLGIRFIPYDITPLGFFITFTLFAFSSYRNQLLNVKTLSLASIYSLLKEAILIFNKQGVIKDSSPSVSDIFNDLHIFPGQSSLEDFMVYLKEHSANWSPDNLFKLYDDGMPERSGELRWYRNDGREQTFTITIRIIKAKYRSVGYILAMSDVSIYRSMITEIYEKNARLEELMKAAEAASLAKSTFLANMSHEIRTPLNAVIGMALIARKSAEDEKTLTAIENIENASKHLLGILNNVLDMSKIESGKLELVYSDFLLRNAMNEVAELILHRCAEKNIRMESRFGNIQNYNVLGDQLRLKQILINLLINAVKFTPENGEIIFALNIIEENDNNLQVHFLVKDNGIGMTEEQLGKLFKAFSQADPAIFNRFGGTGLGLSISQNLTQMMGGEITVTSKENEGSTFEFSLAFPKTGKSLEAADSFQEIPDLSGKRLMLVEDVEINRIIIMELLAETNVEIEIAVNGEEAVRLFDSKPFYYYNLIFMDLQMPVMDGYEATRRIRELNRPDAQSVSIVAMTANAYKEDIEKTFQVGMNGHLAKPIDLNAVMRMLVDQMKIKSGTE